MAVLEILGGCEHQQNLERFTRCQNTVLRKELGMN